MFKTVQQPKQLDRKITEANDVIISQAYTMNKQETDAESDKENAGEKECRIIESTSKGLEHICAHCGKEYSHRSSLYKHKRDAHKDLTNGSIACQEKHCQFTCNSLGSLREHLTKLHVKEMRQETKIFSSFYGR